MNRFAAAAIAATLLFPGAAAAKGPTADEIVAKMIEADPLGYGGAEAEVFMVLVNQRGQQQRRKMITRTRNDDGTRRTYVRFTEPADISGTAFLGVSKGEDRQQHLYMPALGKVRRIAASRRNSRFVGSDYTYADMDYRDIENARKKRLPDEKVDGIDCFVVEARPSSGDSEYSRVTLWVAKRNFLPVRMAYFGKSGEEIKRYGAQKVERVQGRHVITESRMVDLVRNHTTALRAIKVTLREDVPLEQFTVRALDRE